MYNINKQNHYFLAIVMVFFAITYHLYTQSNSFLITRAIKDGVDINRELPNGDTLLTLAVKENDEDAIRCIIESGGDVNKKDINLSTPLSLAVQHNNIKLAELLLKHDANPNAKVDCGTTPLFMSNDIRMLKLLMKYGGSPTLKEDGIALLTRSDIFNSQLLQLYIKKGGNIKELERKETTKLMQAVMLNSLDGAITILRNKQEKDNIDKKDAEGWTALIYACKLGYKDFIKLLIDNGADVNLGNEFNTTPIMFAVEEGHYEILKLLLKAGADVNTKDNAECNALWYIGPKFDNNYQKIADLLLKNGANINSEDIKGNSLLVMNIVFPDYAQYLSKNGASVNGGNYLGESSLMVAVKLCKYNLVSLFLAKKASVNITNRANLTALDYALLNIADDTRIEKKKIIEANLIVQLLRKHGAKTAKELKAEKKNN